MLTLIGHWAHTGQEVEEQARGAPQPGQAGRTAALQLRSQVPVQPHVGLQVPRLRSAGCETRSSDISTRA